MTACRISQDVPPKESRKNMPGGNKKHKKPVRSTSEGSPPWQVHKRWQRDLPMGNTNGSKAS